MNIVSIENVSKHYGDKALFDEVSFNINDIDKMGLIGINGTGKSTLLKIIAGVETPDSGSITIPRGMRIEYLPQNPEFDPDVTVLEQVFKGDSPSMKVIREYEKTVEDISRGSDDSALQEKLIKLSQDMDSQNAWELESQVKMVLTKLGISNFDSKIGTLSGGQRKRVALAGALITPCDLLILDEPTNHMDNSTIEWLEEYLKNRKGALLLITHDRYFLDRVVNRTIELDKGRLYTYTGNYSEFLEKKMERKNLETAMEKKRQNLYRKELEWIRTGAKARTTKQKARIQRFEEIKESKIDIDDSNVEISVGHSRLGKKIIEIKDISKSFGENHLIKNFNYTLLRDDRIGIIGDNGIGKSTLLNVITGKLKIDSGSIDVGTTVKIGYFSQESEGMDESLRAIEYIREGAEYITTSDGSKISASQMMERFLFNQDMQWVYISRLSGGEKRRLHLLRVLMEAPNVLILDEPTNDLDIDTLKVLESYIDEFKGAVITVSHDRYFLDRICTRIFSFEGNGKIVEHTGNYSDFVVYKKKYMRNEVEEQKSEKKKDTGAKRKKEPQLKFSYKEKLEYETIEADIEALENKISELENEIAINSSNFLTLQELTEEKEKIEEKLTLKMERWEYLSELAEKIESSKI
ncbi:ABC-F family ATP-binding cassette domain-containing protein [Wukongibacter baidiensis]|uniref:ABC-F family ATP-binding cassette domain-containing protein n=1 Tax=Wukongibacter baidiensis TaxID=1723361 RepID=UPI003D7F68C8